MFYVIEGVSHTDHRVSEAHINWLRCELEGKLQPGINVVTMTLPEHLPGLHSALVYHPSDEGVTYERRGSRAYESRMVKRHELPTREITAIIGPHNGDTPVLYTAFGGPAAPREPNDPHFDGEGGRCTKCHGAGFVTVDPYLMGDEVRVVCEPCSGTGRSHELRESIKFWANHALATEGPQEWAKEPAQIGTPSAVIPLAMLGHD